MILAIDIYSAGFFMVLGAIIGSFLNVIIFRYGTGRSINGRSGCLSCSQQLRWYHMVPIFSFIALRGRCAHCQTRISRQYVLVEVITAVLFALVANMLWPLVGMGYPELFALAFIFHGTIMACAVIISVYDYRHMIIPVPYVYTWISIGVFAQIVSLIMSGLGTISILNMMAGPILYVFFWLLWYLSKGKAMGYGDAKIALAIGLTLGFSRGIVATVLSFWIGAVIGILVIIYSHWMKSRRIIGLRTETPFGPYMVLGFLLSYFLGLDLLWMASLFAY